MGLFKRHNQSQVVTKYKMITEVGNGYYSWDGNVYKSDIVRACIRPMVKAIGKLTPKHLRNMYDKTDGTTHLQVNPEPYIRVLLEEPNEYMTFQKMLEKSAAQLFLNNNAYILIIRDDNGYPVELYPVPACYAEAKYIGNELYIKFTFYNGKQYTFPYSDIIHLRSDFCYNDIFGEQLADVLAPLMEVVTTTDQGIVNAIKNSSVIKWLLKFTQSLRPEDLKSQAEEFSKNFLAVQNGTGVAATDSKVEAQQVDQKDYVPNPSVMDKTRQRIYSIFNTNESIVQSNYTEDQYNAFYESVIEPVAIELAGEFTRKLFSRKERSYGNKIVFEAFNLSTASMSTKLNLVQFFDRGIMNANEIRGVFNLADIPSGDEYYVRLDTAKVNGEGGENE